MTDNNQEFVPALGKAGNLERYDTVIALMTREKKWRGELLKLVSPAPDEKIVDVGCGTGTFAIELKVASPQSHIIAVDPDPAVLAIARRKASEANVDIEWHKAMGDKLDDNLSIQGCDKIVSSLVLHQCPLDVKKSIARQMRRLLKPGGLALIADYGEQRSPLMRMLFRQVQMIDGFELTEPNARGCIPALLREAEFRNVDEVKVISTPTGSISLYRALR